MAETTEIRLPRLADAVTSVRFGAWLKQEGDRVEAGEPIAEVETDKTTVELEAPAAGVLCDLRVAPGAEDLEVGTVLARVAAAVEEPAGARPAPGAPTPEDEAGPALAGAAASSPGAPPVAGAAAGGGPAGGGPAGAVSTEAPAVRGEVARDEAPVVRDDAPAARGDAPAVRSGAVAPRRGGRSGDAPAAQIGGDAAPEPARAATPLALRMAAAAGLDLAAVRPAGSDGRIRKADVDRVLAARRGASGEGDAPSAPGVLSGREGFLHGRLDAGGVGMLSRRAGTLSGAETSSAGTPPGESAEPAGPAPGGPAPSLRPAPPDGPAMSPGALAPPAPVEEGAPAYAGTARGALSGSRSRPAPVEEEGAPAYAAPPHREQPLTAMRRVTATRMQQAKQTVPHFYLRIECRVDAALRFLAAARRYYPDAPPTVTDLVVRAAACALRAVPRANAAWVDGVVRVYDRVDVAVAVDTPHGLVAPVVRGAERKDLGAIARETRDLAARAREARLASAEYAGGTFTISNLGMRGVESLYAIVNPPQSCILGVGAATRRPVADGGVVGVGTVMACTLSADHRVIDGAAGAELLDAVRTRLEEPGLMLLPTGPAAPPAGRRGPP